MEEQVVVMKKETWAGEMKQRFNDELPKNLS